MTTPNNIKKTKIIATLGPASDSPDILEKMIIKGVDVIRLNASHRSDPTTIRKNVQMIRKLSKKCRQTVGMFLDLQGPKIRVGKFKNEKVELKKGDMFTLTTKKITGTNAKCSVSYEGFANDVQPNERLYIDDGKIRLVVTEKRGEDVLCQVEHGGMLSNHKGVNLPESNLKISPLTEKDRQDVKLAVENKLDYVALSFVSHPDDIRMLRNYIDELGGKNIQIIAKVERQFAIDHIIPIIEEADGIMVARGDLGVEVGVENVPRYQKMIIHECNRRTTPVIVATQMLESMIYSKIATRAEVSDVANAIYDRCDAVMLSGETAIGVDPVAAIKTMTNICKASDEHMITIKQDEQPTRDWFHVKDRVTSFCKAADQIAEENNADAIMAFTSSGNTSMVASKLSPILPIISPTDEHHICQRMTIYRGVIPMMMPKKFKDIHRWTDMIRLAVREAKDQGLLKTGDTVVVTAGIPIGESRGINSIRIITVT